MGYLHGAISCAYDVCMETNQNNKTVIIDGYTVTKIKNYGRHDSYEYRGITVWRTTERATALSNGAGWKFKHGTRELVGGATEAKVFWNKTRAEAFAEIDCLLGGN